MIRLYERDAKGLPRKAARVEQSLTYETPSRRLNGHPWLLHSVHRHDLRREGATLGVVGRSIDERLRAGLGRLRLRHRVQIDQQVATQAASRTLVHHFCPEWEGDLATGDMRVNADRDEGLTVDAPCIDREDVVGFCCHEVAT
jgi:hypothetical protein